MNITPDNGCCGQQQENNTSNPGHIQYQFDTPGATVNVEVRDKREPDPDRGAYRAQCHDVLDKCEESGSRKQTLLVDRINRLVRALQVWKGHARRLRERLQELTTAARDTLRQCNDNQYDLLTKVNDALQPVDNSTTPLSEKVSSLVNRYLGLQERHERTAQILNEGLSNVGLALQQVEEAVTKEIGIDARHNGDYTSRIKALGEHLIQAIDANKAWASAGATLGITATTKADYEKKIALLQQENNRLRNETSNVRIYSGSVAQSHAKLDDLGVPKGGSVSARIQVFVDSIRTKMFAVDRDSLRQELAGYPTPTDAVAELVTAFNKTDAAMKKILS